MYYLCSENKGADQLRSYCEADLRLCFRLCRMLVFPCGGSCVLYLFFFRHFEGFFGCVKLHALLNGETCPIQDLEAMVRNRTDLGQFSICKGKYTDSVGIW